MVMDKARNSSRGLWSLRTADYIELWGKDRQMARDKTHGRIREETLRCGRRPEVEVMWKIKQG